MQKLLLPLLLLLLFQGTDGEGGGWQRDGRALDCCLSTGHSLLLRMLLCGHLQGAGRSFQRSHQEQRCPWWRQVSIKLLLIGLTSLRGLRVVSDPLAKPLCLHVAACTL